MSFFEDIFCKTNFVARRFFKQSFGKNLLNYYFKFSWNYEALFFADILFLGAGNNYIRDKVFSANFW